MGQTLGSQQNIAEGKKVGPFGASRSRPTREFSGFRRRQRRQNSRDFFPLGDGPQGKKVRRRDKAGEWDRANGAMLEVAIGSSSKTSICSAEPRRGERRCSKTRAQPQAVGQRRLGRFAEPK
jgi:hypothetical protein